MIVTLKGANFSTNNINDLLNSYSISYYGNGVSGSPSSVAKDIGGDLTCTLTITEGYTYKSLSVSVGGVTLNNDQYEIIGSGDKVVIYNANITGNIMINVVTEGSAVEPDEPTNYTFTINPTPTSATVTLTASGYTQSGNSITVPNGTTVSWSVSASGYTTQTGTWTANGSNKTENVVLVASGGEDEDNILSGITMVHGNAFLASPTTDTNRASSSINFYVDGSKKISLKDSTNYDYALYTCTDETTQAGGVGSGWIIDTRVYTDVWVGVCLKKKDGSNFDFSTESNLLSNYITVE